MFEGYRKYEVTHFQAGEINHSHGRRKSMRRMKHPIWLWIIFAAGFLVNPEDIVAQEPTSPYGQSNSFELDTNRIGFGTTGIFFISSAPDISGVPTAISIQSLVPNPFNPSITISFNVGQSGTVELNIYDLIGRRINSLVSQQFEIGQYSRQWDGRDNNGSMMPAGVYLVQIKSDTTTDSKKVTLVK